MRRAVLILNALACSVRSRPIAWRGAATRSESPGLRQGRSRRCAARHAQPERAHTRRGRRAHRPHCQLPIRCRAGPHPAQPRCSAQAVRHIRDPCLGAAGHHLPVRDRVATATPASSAHGRSSPLAAGRAGRECPAFALRARGDGATAANETEGNGCPCAGRRAPFASQPRLWTTRTGSITGITPGVNANTGVTDFWVPDPDPRQIVTLFAVTTVAPI